MNLKTGGKYMNEKEKLDLKWAEYIEEYRKKYEDGLAAAGEKEDEKSLGKVFSQEGSSGSNVTDKISGTSSGESNKSGKGEAVLGAAAGSVMTGALGSLASSSKSTFGDIVNNGGNNGAAEQIKAQTFYKGKNVGLRINDETMDIKDVEMNITKEFSRHDELFMRFTIKTEEVSKYYSYVFSFDNSLEIELAESDMVFKRVFHTFNIEKIDIEESMGERSVVIIKTPSATYQMDKIKEFKSFQDMNLTYETIIEGLKEKYSAMKWFIGRELSQNLKKPYIQYNETDWEFLVRVAGDLNIPLSSHLDSVIMGNEINLMEENAELRNAIYGKCRDGVNILFKVRNSTQAVNVGQRMKITLPDQGLNGEEGEDIRIVSKAYIRIEETQVITDYELVQESHRFDPVLHTEFEGKSIEATVMDVVSEDGIAKMKIDLSAGLLKLADNDKSKGYEDEYKGSFNYPYGTDFSQGMTGFFCTPDAGDRVVLTFPSRNESHAYVIQGAVNSQGNDRFNNRDNRNFNSSPSANGQPMFNFTLSNEVFSVDVTDYIGLTASNNISINATSGSISETAQNSITMSAPSGDVITTALKASVTGMDSVDITGMNKASVTSASEAVLTGGVAKVKGGKIEIN